MTEETYGFEQARVRLEEIAAQVKRKDTSLEKSLDLLEEGVRLANLCTEQIDHTQWRAVEAPPADRAEVGAGIADEAADEEPVTAEASADDAAEAAEDEADQAAPDEDADDSEPSGPAPYDQAAEA